MATRFRKEEPGQLRLLPPNLREWVPEGHLAHHISDLVEGMDLGAFYAPYAGDGRRNAPYEPRMLVCEDRQHEVFVRRFLRRYGWSGRVRVRMAPSGRGSAAAWVQEHFPVEVAAHRTQASKRETRLIVMIDGDEPGRERRPGRAPPRPARSVMPGQRHPAAARHRADRDRDPDLEHRDLARLASRPAGGRSERKDYPRLKRESECQPQVRELIGTCKRRRLREGAPVSLRAACSEFPKRLR